MPELGPGATGAQVLVVPAAVAEMVWSGSLGYATGDYTLSETTETWFLLNELAWVDERWSLSVTLPVVDRSTPYVTLVGPVQPIPTGRRYGAPAEPATPANAANTSTSAEIFFCMLPSFAKVGFAVARAYFHSRPSHRMRPRHFRRARSTAPKP